MIPKKEYGDFQTSLSLARRVAALVEQDEMQFGTIIEPTCGVGAFLQAAAERFGRSPKYWGFDVNPDYVKAASAALAWSDRPLRLFSSATSTLPNGRSSFLSRRDPC